jgi:hypothetical protein
LIRELPTLENLLNALCSVKWLIGCIGIYTDI